MKPILLDYAVNRTGDDTPVFRYDEEMCMNVIDMTFGAIPFIDIGGSEIELQTKTKAQRESDDNISYSELATKTRVQRESDDNHGSYLELATKTEVRREKEDDHSQLLELAVKTLVKRERDDDSAYY